MKYTAQKLPTIAFTQEGYDKMQAEFDGLTLERVEVLKRLQTAREMGDLSENGAYKAARFELGGIDRRLRRLTYLLRVGKVTKALHDGTVQFGSRVTVDNAGKQMTFLLVNEFESNPSERKLSTNSPIGKAVFGRKQGETVTMETPNGEKVLKIMQVE